MTILQSQKEINCFVKYCESENRRGRRLIEETTKRVMKAKEEFNRGIGCGRIPQTVKTI